MRHIAQGCHAAVLALAPMGSFVGRLAAKFASVNTPLAKSK